MEALPIHPYELVADPIEIDRTRLSLYQVIGREEALRVKEFIVSSPETRSICNDPAVLGLEYTRNLSSACAKTLATLRKHSYFSGREATTSVLTILRGGLNFGLREALGEAFGWNRHSSWFISAQRELLDESQNTWGITEDSYRKVFLTERADVILGDVVATGTSFQHGLEMIAKEVSPNNRLNSLLFFTIGAPVAAEILSQWRKQIESRQEAPISCAVVYLEGMFAVADARSPLTIKIPGTDLLRRDSLLAPEFIDSQYEAPSYPLERCTIYDAGSRAFHIDEYLTDVIEYWEAVKGLAQSGMSFGALLQQRCPELHEKRFEAVALEALANERLGILKSLALS